MSQTITQEIPETILEQLKQSRVNGFPFFAYTGIKGFVLMGNDSLMLKNIPRNPNKITNVTVAYDAGQDLYNVYLFQKNQATIPHKQYDGIFCDQLAEIIARDMGVL